MFALRSGFGWLSTIPVGISMEGIEAMMRNLWVFPLVGATLGVIFAFIAYLLGLCLPSQAVAIIVVLAFYKLCGINHIDGLADFGDGITAHGTLEKKIQAMKDVNLGSGGGFCIAFILIVLFSAISSMNGWLLPLALISAEICAKLSMITFAAFTTSFQKGFGQMMIERTNYRDFVFSTIISAPICILLLGYTGLAMLILSVLSSIYLAFVSKRHFGGGSGDGIGACNEIGRGAALCVAFVMGLPSWSILSWM